MSSLCGAAIAGKRSCRIATIAAVSSTESVVCVMKASLSGRFGWKARASASVSIRRDRARRQAGPSCRSTSGMAGMADEHDLAALAVRWISASRCTLVTSGQVASRWNRLRRCAASRDRLGDAVRREDHRLAGVGNFVELLDEHRALRLQALDDVAVVDDLVADIDRRPEFLERQLDDLDRPVDAGAEAARAHSRMSRGGLAGRHRRVGPVRMAPE